MDTFSHILYGRAGKYGVRSLFVVVLATVGCPGKMVEEKGSGERMSDKEMSSPNEESARQRFMDDGLRQPTDKEIEQMGRIYAVAEKTDENSMEVKLVKDAVFAFPLTRVDTVYDVRRLGGGLFVATGEMDTGLYIYKVRVNNSEARVEDCFRYAVY